MVVEERETVASQPRIGVIDRRALNRFQHSVRPMPTALPSHDLHGNTTHAHRE